ncbi:MAG: phage holin [Firmicutes bacterium]|nr:phage holin [Bacillota bacterium]
MGKSFLSNRAYDVLKWICIIVLPALATLYRGVGTIWSLPYVEEIPQTIIVIDAFLGALLGVSTINYNKDETL